MFPAMNGGDVISPRVLYPRFGETTGKVSDVDWLFGLDEADPWVKTYVVVYHPLTATHSAVRSPSSYSWRANSNVVRRRPASPGLPSFSLSDSSQVFHASYVLQVVSKRINQTLVPMRSFVIGSANLQTRRFSTDNLSSPWRDEFTVRPSPSAKAASISAPLDARKLSGHVSPLNSPMSDSTVKKSQYMRIPLMITVPPLTGLAEQTTLVDSLAPHDNPEPPKQDRTSDTFPQIPLLPVTVTTAPLCQDCPRIDLVALVREKQKVKNLQEKQLSVPKKLRRRKFPQGLNSKKSR